MPDAMRKSDLVLPPSPAEARVDRMLLGSILLSPLAVGINTIVGYTVAHWAIAVNRKTENYAVAVFDLALCLVAVALAWRAQSSLSELSDATQDDRRKFMATLGILLSGFCAIVVVASTVALVTLLPSD
jgi:hypothetical protein